MYYYVIASITVPSSHSRLFLFSFAQDHKDHYHDDCGRGCQHIGQDRCLITCSGIYDDSTVIFLY